MQEFKIGPNEEGQRLDKFLHKYLKEAGTSFLYKMLRKKNITLNKKKADGKEMLHSGDVVQFFFSDETFHKFRGSSSTNDNVDKKQQKKSMMFPFYSIRRLMKNLKILRLYSKINIFYFLINRQVFFRRNHNLLIFL